jgi:hypothetical protein
VLLIANRREVRDAAKAELGLTGLASMRPAGQSLCGQG